MRHLQWMLTGLRPKTAYDRHHSQSSIDFRACRMIGKMSLSVFLALIFSGYLPAQTQPVSQNPVAQLWARVSDLLMDPSKVGTVEDVTLQRDVATLTLNRGQICLSRPLQAAGSHERVVGAVFEGLRESSSRAYVGDGTATAGVSQQGAGPASRVRTRLFHLHRRHGKGVGGPGQIW